jgi:hypothetical protein
LKNIFLEIIITPYWECSCFVVSNQNWPPSLGSDGTCFLFYDAHSIMVIHAMQQITPTWWLGNKDHFLSCSFLSQRFRSSLVGGYGWGLSWYQLKVYLSEGSAGAGWPTSNKIHACGVGCCHEAPVPPHEGLFPGCSRTLVTFSWLPLCVIWGHKVVGTMSVKTSFRSHTLFCNILVSPIQRERMNTSESESPLKIPFKASYHNMFLVKRNRRHHNFEDH